MAGLCEGGNEPAGSLKAICKVDTQELLEESTMPWVKRSARNASESKENKKQYNVVSYAENPRPRITVRHRATKRSRNTLNEDKHVKCEREVPHSLPLCAYRLRP
ncbi:hypothetical protein ANN_24100 [Periplaneta americana]|uniref:Uncharacterized protein n=1 Tax=Periplaneta americana TaxID=6978 RepID=A0ABQ8S2E9_PERAM|nr:hypothetical protein ANN_24100 [Periplaneta americana]